MSARLRFTAHFEDMVHFRSIDIDHVRKAVLDPDFTEVVFDGKLRARKEIGKGKAIEVIYRTKGLRGKNEYLIITAYYIDEAS